MTLVRRIILALAVIVLGTILLLSTLIALVATNLNWGM